MNTAANIANNNTVPAIVAPTIKITSKCVLPSSAFEEPGLVIWPAVEVSCVLGTGIQVTSKVSISRWQRWSRVVGDS